MAEQGKEILEKIEDLVHIVRDWDGKVEDIKGLCEELSVLTADGHRLHDEHT